MPCECHGYPEPEPDSHNGPLADALCKVMAEHELRNEMSCFDAKTLAWWKEHKKRDLARINMDLAKTKNDKAKNKALKKLTAFERKLLGL